MTLLIGVLAIMSVGIGFGFMTAMWSDSMPLKLTTGVAFALCFMASVAMLIFNK